MHEFKKAFSLPEILMVLGIVGTIVVIMITMIRPDEQILKSQYMKAYNLVNIAAYNAYVRSLNNAEVVKFYAENEEDGTKDFCEALCKYINTISSDCSQENTDPTGATLDVDKINIVSSNDMRFWVITPVTFDDGKSYHRIIWVDINGKRKPNSSVKSGLKLPDIVPFSVNDFGEAIPLGFPKTNRAYMQAKVVYPDESTLSLPMTFLQAQYAAFGGTEYEYDPMSYNFDEKYSSWANTPIHITGGGSISEDCENSEGIVFPKCTVEITP